MKKNLLHFSRRSYSTVLLLTLLSFLGVGRLSAQVTTPYYSWGTYFGTSSGDLPEEFFGLNGTGLNTFNSGSEFYTDAENGHIYVWGNARGSDLPVTPDAIQPANAGGIGDFFLAKFDADNGALLYSTYLGGSGRESYDFNFGRIVVADGYMYLAGRTTSTNFPVTPDAFQPANAGDGDIVFVKMDANTGQLVYSTYLGGNAGDSPVKLLVENGVAYIVSQVSSNNFPVTADAYQPTYGGGSSDLSVAKIDVNTGQLLYATYIGGSGTEDPEVQAAIDNGRFYLFGSTNSTDLPITPNAFQAANAGQADFFGFAMDAGNNNVLFSSYYGGSGQERLTGGTPPPWRVNGNSTNRFIIAEDGDIYFLSSIQSADFPTTVDAIHPTPVSSIPLPPTFAKSVLIKLDPLSGDLIYSTYVGGGAGFASNLLLKDDKLYVLTTVFPGVSGSLPITPDAAFPTGFGGIGSEAYFLMELNVATSSLEYASYYGSSNLDQSGIGSLAADDKHLYLAFTTFAPLPGLSSDAFQPGQSQLALQRLDRTTKQVDYATYLGGADLSGERAFISGISVRDNKLHYFSSQTRYPDFPVTANAVMSTSTTRDMTLSTFDLCPPLPDDGGQVSPLTQEVCSFGAPEPLNGSTVVISSDSFPTIFRNGVPESQSAIVIRDYQWQQSSSPTGPWANLPGATQEDFVPEIGNATTYFRRIATNCCQDTIFSNVVEVVVNGLPAPEVLSADPVYTCPNQPVEIGGSPTATGGTGTLSYQWDMAGSLDDDMIANPIATVSESTIFTVTVTDDNNCRQIGQFTASVVTADAGPDQSGCAGTGVRIGTPGIAGAGEVTYSWSVVSGDPITSLSDPNVAQPIANPSLTTTYELTVTVTLPGGGGTCMTTDQVTVNAAPAPGVDFAGPDVTVCNTGTVQLGVANSPDYEYYWSPGANLSVFDEGITTFEGTFPQLIEPQNPRTYTLTAERNGCFFQDQVVVYQIEANAGEDDCGPRFIGEGDRTPDINETYSWTHVSGPDRLDPATANQPQAFVGGVDIGEMASVYQLEVCSNGVCCTDQVTVTPCGCSVSIGVSDGNCPDFDLPGPVTLIATETSVPDPDILTYTWTPMVGLNTYTGREVILTDSVERTYTVTVSHPDDPTFGCSAMITVNQTNYGPPPFTAQDAFVCEGQTVNIGQPDNADYSYSWEGPGGFTSTISDPAVSLPGDYFVTVTDILTGCFSTDMATVEDGSPVANAGLDWVICDQALVTLGTPDPSGGVWTYNWTPVATWENGTSAASPQPQLLAASNLTFTVEVTNPLTGCTATDMMVITEIPNPTIDAPDVSVCLGAGVVIGPTDDLPGVTYSWLPTAGLSCTDCRNPLASPSATQTYTVTALFPGGCAVTDDVMVTVNDPTFDLGADITYCPAGGAVNIGAAAPAGATSYSWSPAAYLNDPTIANPQANPPTAITYTLTIIDANGCMAMDEITVSPQSNLTAGPDRSACVGEPVLLGNAGNGGTITWSGAGIADLDDINSPNPIFTPSAAGIYTFTVTQDDAGCINTDQVTITVNEYNLPSFPQAVSVCTGGCVEIGLPAETGVIYSWAPTAGIQSPNRATTIVCPTQTTTYTLTAFDTETGCSSTANVLVSVSNESAPVVTIPDVEVCLGETAVLMPMVTPAGSYDYTWDPSTNLDNPYIETPTVIGLTVGQSTYNLSVTNPANNCNTIANANVDVILCSSNTGTVSGHLYIDTNGNGTQDAGEPDLANVDVIVTDVFGNMQTVTTDVNGDWTATVPEGSTTADVDENDGDYPTGYTQTEGTDPTTVIAVVGMDTDAGNDGYFTPPGSIGNRIWADEDGDGVQDPGEDGIANVTVELVDGSNTVIATATTGVDGDYIFKGVAPGTYTVRVVTASLPANVDNPTYDEDGTGTPNQTVVTVGTGEEYETADFGYNGNTPGETDTPVQDQLGALGDRIWNDADGDGVQDPGESGIGGVTVNLYADNNNDGIYDDLVGTTTTDADGGYLFDDLPPGGYVVEVDETSLPAGYTAAPTGDPDGDGDNVSDPVVIAPGDVWLNGDFGYTRPQGSDIGDELFVDINGDGVKDANEPGIPGVTVSLEDNLGNVIATTTTDENGEYLFPGLPAGTYTVKVTDTENVLGDLTPVSDGDGIGTPNESTTTVDGVNPELDQDFGYAPAGHDPGEGLIGDEIYVDLNGNGTADAGEGIEGVRVNLLDDGGNLIGVTTTDENGNYYFGGLPVDESYQIVVDASNFASGGVLEGYTNTADPNGGNDNQGGLVSLPAGNPVNLDQDFGYEGPHSIAGTLWEDTDADGSLDGTETDRFEGVTVVLKDDEGNIVGTTTTAPDGNYEFDNIPDGDYTVEVTDEDGVLGGYWGSTTDPRPVTVTGAPVMDIDFGYYNEGASLGNRVFEDVNGNGLQDVGEPGVAGVEVDLTITYPDGTEVTLTTTTDATGFYSFPNLLLDEDYNGDGAGAEPTYEISIDVNQAALAGLVPTQLDQGVNDNLDADDPAGVSAQPVQGAVDVTPNADPDLEEDAASYDFGLICNVQVTVAEPFEICGTGRVDLTEDASILPAGLGGTWDAPDGDGTFDGGTDFDTATTYTPGPQDRKRGSVTLVLTSNDPDGPCEAVSAQVTITIRNVDCGNFPWDGN